MAVGKVGLFLLQVTGVGQQDGAQFRRGRRAVDRAGEALSCQQRQVAAVVQMGVGEDDGVDVGRWHWQGRPVAQAQRLVALEQAAIDQQALAAVGHQIFGAGDRVGRTEKLELHGPNLAMAHRS